MIKATSRIASAAPDLASKRTTYEPPVIRLADKAPERAVDWLDLASLDEVDATSTRRDGLVVDVLAHDQLDAIMADWRHLAVRSGDDNVFFEADILAAALGYMAPAAARLVTIWDEKRETGQIAGARRRLLGVIPLVVDTHRHGPGLGVSMVWTHPYCMRAVPLIDRDRMDAVVLTLLDFLAKSEDWPGILHLPNVMVDGEFARSLTRLSGRQKVHSALCGQRERGFLRAGPGREDYIRQSVGKKRDKEFARLKRRLGDEGPVRLEHFRGVAGVAQGFEIFLDLEQKGWKGQQGTALQSLAADRMFFADSLERMALHDAARVDVLYVGDKPIAALVNLLGGSTVYTWKIAHDEAYERSSPGVLLMVDSTNENLRDLTVTDADSCASGERSMIDNLWRDRLQLADLLIMSGDHGAAGRFAHAVRAERWRIAGRARLKALYHSLKTLPKRLKQR